MSIPNLVKTEWWGAGAAVLKFTDLNCDECQKEWDNKEKWRKDSNSVTKTSCPYHSKYITCFMSFQKVREYEHKNNLFRSKYPWRRPFLLQKPAAISDCLWEAWTNYWNRYCKFFIDLAFVYRFPTDVKESSYLWLLKVFKRYPYLKNHIQYYENVPLISEPLLANVDKKKTDEYNKIVEDVWCELSVKRTYVHLRLFLYVMEYPLNEEMKFFFANEGITEDPSPNEYGNHLNIPHGENSNRYRKKIIESSHTQQKSENTTQLEDVVDSTVSNDNTVADSGFHMKLSGDASNHLNSEEESEENQEFNKNQKIVETNYEEVTNNNENMALLCKDSVMETNLYEKETNFEANFDENPKSDPDFCIDLKELSNSEKILDLDNKIQDHLKVEDEKENINPIALINVQTNGDTITDNGNEIELNLNTKKRGGKKKKNSKTVNGIAWALNHIQQKYQNTNPEDIDSSTDNGNAVVNSDSQLKTSGDAISYLSTVEGANDYQEFDKNEKIVETSCEQVNPELDIHPNNKENEKIFKTSYEEVNPGINMLTNFEEHEEIFKRTSDVIYPTCKGNNKTFRTNYEELDPLSNINPYYEDEKFGQTDYEEVIPETRMSPKNDDKKIVLSDYNEVYPKDFKYHNYEGNKFVNTDYDEVMPEVDMYPNYEDEEVNPEMDMYPNYEDENVIETGYEEFNSEMDMYLNYEDENFVETDYNEVNSEDMFPYYDENEEESHDFTPISAESSSEKSSVENKFSVYGRVISKLRSWLSIFSLFWWLEWFGYVLNKEKISAENTVKKKGKKCLHIKPVVKKAYNPLFAWFRFGLGEKKNVIENPVVNIGINILYFLVNISTPAIKKVYDPLHSWFVPDVDKKTYPYENEVKSTERNCVTHFLEIFNLKKKEFEKSCKPKFSFESLHITEVKKSEILRESYENLFKIERNATNEKSKGYTEEVCVQYMSKEDIDYELLYPEETDPLEKEYYRNNAAYLSQFDDNAPAVEGITESEECIQNLENYISNDAKGEKIEGQSNNACGMGDWMLNSEIQFDENGDLKAVPFKSDEELIGEMKLPEKMKNIIKNYDLIQFSADEKDLKQAPPKDFPEEIIKYWHQRYRLFLKYDEDIRLDTGM
ncbi:UNVERIFIED_CONTAM: hypothetical protein RMT77_008508 [Armadillidium vulgare]